MSELGDCSLIHLLTGWTPLMLPIKTYSLDEVWSTLVDGLPMWKRGDPYSTEDQRRKKKCLVLAGFTSAMNRPPTRPLPSTQAQAIVCTAVNLRVKNISCGKVSC